MPRPVRITTDVLGPLIRAHGPISATELAALTSANRTTVVRALASFGDELVTIGATRATRYLLRRSIGSAGDRWRVYRIDANGQASEWAELAAMHDRNWRVTWAAGPPEWAVACTGRHGMWRGFPFFLGDVRPQGFLGRLTAKDAAVSLGVPEDPRSWSDDHILLYLQARGIDLPGDLVVGDQVLRGALAQIVTPAAGALTLESDRALRYPEYASGVLRMAPGSSAGGEQPKFLATLEMDEGGIRQVLVKFTAELGNEVAWRWGDLLRCEGHAHRVLARVASGLSIPGVQFSEAGGRGFLEVPRFDRTARGGRLGVVSLDALAHSALEAHHRTWTSAVAELERRGWVCGPTLADVHRLEFFGELIGNTDMHLGNLGFWLNDRLPFELAPVYDMLPMLWAPGPQGELSPKVFAPAPPVPAWKSVWREASDWAVEFWTAVSADDQITDGFRRIAADALMVIRRLRGR